MELISGLRIAIDEPELMRNWLAGDRAFSAGEIETAKRFERVCRVQTVFLMTGLRWIFTSSSIIKEAIQFGGNIDGMVPKLVQKKLKQKYGLLSEQITNNE